MIKDKIFTFSFRLKIIICAISIMGSILTIATSKSFAWTITADFEGGALDQKAQPNPSGFTNAFTQTLYSNEQAKTGTQSAKITWTAGLDGWGRSGGTFEFANEGLTEVFEGDEIWARAYFYFPSNFSFSANPHLKVFRVLNIRTPTNTNIGWHDIYATPNRELKYISEVQPTANSGPLGVFLNYDQWQALEMYIKLSATPGQGIVRIWKDGVLIFQNTTKETMSASSNKGTQTFLFTYWNTAAPQNQFNYVDNIEISTQQPSNRDAQGNYMIGPTGGAKPSPPTNLQ